jgi:hypothetical protein
MRRPARGQKPFREFWVQGEFRLGEVADATTAPIPLDHQHVILEQK